MRALSSVKELNKILREVLVSQSQLSQSKVLNALSIHGEDLDELFEEQIYTSIERYEVMILFELQSRRNTSDVSMTNDDGTITLDRSFALRVVIYGNDSSDVANLLVARLRTENIRNFLHEQGVYLEKINEPDILNEYKNNTMWLRNDIEIDIISKFNITQTELESEFSQLALMKILEIKEN